MEKKENYELSGTDKSESNMSRKEEDNQENFLGGESNLILDRSRKEKEATEKNSFWHQLQTETLETKRVVKVTKGGRRFSFTSLVLVKDKNKKAVAFAYAGGKEVTFAFRKSSREAQKKLITYFPIPPQTISKDIEINYRGITVLLKPASPGTGIKAGTVLNTLFKCLEIKDISATIICSRRKRKNKLVVIRAAFMALDKLTGKKYDY